MAREVRVIPQWASLEEDLDIRGMLSAEVAGWGDAVLSKNAQNS